MKILSPLDSIDEIEDLARTGADEFFCGVLEEQWYEKYPVISINRRPAGRGHFKSFSHLTDAVKKAHDLGRKVYFTLNEHYYVHEQYPLIRQYLDGALSAGVDALIITDFGLMAFVQEAGYGIPVHISTGGTVFNWRAVAFFKENGAANITFPRHLTIKELRDITEKMPPMDTTVFILNSRCINVDGFCTFQHGLAGKEIFPMFRNACMLPYDIAVFNAQADTPPLPFAQQAAMIERQKVWEKVHVDDHPCGACAVYEFHRMGIGSLKIVGRGNPLERKIRDVGFIKKLCDMLTSPDLDRGAYRKRAQGLYQQTYNRPCRIHMCYYPEVMQHE